MNIVVGAANRQGSKNTNNGMKITNAGYKNISTFISHTSPIWSKYVNKKGILAQVYGIGNVCGIFVPSQNEIIVQKAQVPFAQINADTCASILSRQLSAIRTTNHCF
jgi:hypothetical protein